MTISARHARTEDVAPIVALWQRFMIEESEAVPEADPEAAAGPWTVRLRSQIVDLKVVVAENCGVLVGFLGFIDSHDRPWVPAGIAYVVDLYVAPEARRTTTARELFAAAAVLLRARYAETWTNTHVKNTRMQVLLKRARFEPLIGFVVEGLRDQMYYRLDNRVTESVLKTRSGAPYMPAG